MPWSRGWKSEAGALSKKRHSLNPMKSILILSVLLLISSGCASTTTTNKKPVKPVLMGLSDHPTDISGLCFDGRALSDIQLYILDLERGYE